MFCAAWWVSIKFSTFNQGCATTFMRSPLVAMKLIFQISVFILFISCSAHKEIVNSVKPEPWRQINSSLYIDTNGRLGFATDPSIVNIPRNELEGERCANVFLTTIGSQGKQSLNETILSSKFINAIVNEDLSKLEGKTKKGASEILEKLNSNEEWKISLYVVSNEDIEITSKDHHLEQMEKVYGLEVIPVGLEQISQFITLRPNPVNAELIVDNDAIMSFSESSISSSKSYIIRLPLSEIIRITCTDNHLRMN